LFTRIKLFDSAGNQSTTLVVAGDTDGTQLGGAVIVHGRILPIHGTIGADLSVSGAVSSQSGDELGTFAGTLWGRNLVGSYALSAEGTRVLGPSAQATYEQSDTATADGAQPSADDTATTGATSGTWTASSISLGPSTVLATPDASGAEFNQN
jgi:hypothetical protein